MFGPPLLWINRFVAVNKTLCKVHRHVNRERLTGLVDETKALP